MRVSKTALRKVERASALGWRLDSPTAKGPADYLRKLRLAKAKPSTVKPDNTDELRGAA